MGQAFTEAYKKKLEKDWLNNPPSSRRAFAKRHGINPSSVDKWFAHLPIKAEPKPTAAETSEVKGDEWSITLPKTNIHTLEQLVEYCQIDTQIWEVERFVANKWEVGAKGDDNKVHVTPLYQIKAFLKRRRTMVDAREEIEALKAEAKKGMAVPKPVVYSTLKSDNMLELLIPDLHVAKLAYSKETGFQNYDTSIAVETYRRTIDSLLQRASKINLDKIILGVGNDLLQADNIQGTTFSGTKVDTDSRYRKTYVTVRQMLSEAIEKLRKIAPVDVKVVPGNHDTLSAFTMGDSLECKFHNYKDVYVDNAPIQHKTVEWGNVFLILTHGDKGRQQDYGIWMASTYPKEFGRTKFREIHVGHKHKAALDEKFGVRVRTLSALCPPDEWHSANNFTGNLRVAEGLVFNKHHGLTDHYYHTEVD